MNSSLRHFSDVYQPPAALQRARVLVPGRVRGRLGIASRHQLSGRGIAAIQNSRAFTGALPSGADHFDCQVTDPFRHSPTSPFIGCITVAIRDSDRSFAHAEKCFAVEGSDD